MRKSNFFIFGIIILLGFFLRLYRYDQFPIYGETADERAWSYIGSSIIQEGIPGSWSHFGAYDDHGARFSLGDEATIVQPALDHPPIFALIPGLAHSIQGVWHRYPSVRVIRLPMLLLAFANLILFYRVVDLYFKSNRLKLFSLIIFSLGPIYVFSSRLVIAENLLITLVLFALLILHAIESSKQTNLKIYFLFFGLGVVSIMTKVSGVVIPGTVALIGMRKKDKRLVISGIASLFIGIALFCAFGAFYNWGLFLDLQFSQAGREIGLSTTINRFFFHSSLISKYFVDGWWFLGLISVVAVSLVRQWSDIFTFFFISIVVFIGLTTGEQTFHGWYDYILYPFMAIASGLTIDLILKKKSWLSFVFVWTLLLSSIRLLASHLGIYYDWTPLIIRSFYMAGFLPWTLSLLSDNLSKKAALTLLALIIVSNILLVFSFSQESYWIDDNFYYLR